MSDYNKPYGTVNTDAEREALLVDKVAERLSGQIAGIADQAAQKAVGGLNLDSILSKAADKLARQDADRQEQARNTPPTNPDAGTFRVTGPGYSEQFTSKRTATTSFEALKKRLIRNEQAAVVRLAVQVGAKWQTVQEVKLTEDHF